jgi:hypothetical protein
MSSPKLVQMIRIMLNEIEIISSNLHPLLHRHAKKKRKRVIFMFSRSSLISYRLHLMKQRSLVTQFLVYLFY